MLLPSDPFLISHVLEEKGQTLRWQAQGTCERVMYLSVRLAKINLSLCENTRGPHQPHPQQVLLLQPPPLHRSSRCYQGLQA